MKTLRPILTVALALGLSTAAWSLQGRGARGSAPQESEAEAAQRRLAEQYFPIADRDGNGWISFREAREALEIDKPRYLVYDSDRDGRVTLEEYTAVCLESWRRYGAFPPPKPDPDDPEAVARAEELAASAAGSSEAEAAESEPVRPASIKELFGRPIPRAPREGGRPEPDRIVGPVPSFRRVDHDDDGAISPEDLDLLLFGSGIDARPAALIAALDTDGDGRVSEAEFFASMRDPR
jgi:Ca2+-binding EF-hand superfamily protein